jgi:uncharacterized OsmC-like protein
MDAIRRAFERCAKALSMRPTLGRSTAVSRTRIRPGVTCEIEDGAWELTADLSARLAGSGAAPSPGVFGRAALGSCLAIGYMLQAAQRRVPIASLEVEIQTDDSNGASVSTTPPGYGEVRYTVTVESAAPELDVRRVIDEGDAHSPYLRVVTDPRPCRRTVRVVAPREG